MNAFGKLCFVFGLSLLVSCGTSQYARPTYNPEPTTPPPGNTNPPEPLPERLSFEIGAVQRQFFEQDSAACIFDPARGQVTVTFSNIESGSSFSTQFEGINASSGTYHLDSNQLGDSLILALGGKPSENNYRLSEMGEVRFQTPNPQYRGRCQIQFRMEKDTSLSAKFACSGLVNSVGQTQTASGEWLCRVQQVSDWNW